MKHFIDQSTASREEKARRFLRSLASAHDYKYFYGDGCVRHAELMNDAAATLEVFESLSAKATAPVGAGG